MNDKALNGKGFSPIREDAFLTRTSLSIMCDPLVLQNPHWVKYKKTLPLDWKRQSDWRMSKLCISLEQPKWLTTCAFWMWDVRRFAQISILVVTLFVHSVNAKLKWSQNDWTLDLDVLLVGNNTHLHDVYKNYGFFYLFSSFICILCTVRKFGGYHVTFMGIFTMLIFFLHLG